MLAHFADSDNCREFMVSRSWPNGVSGLCAGAARVAFVWGSPAAEALALWTGADGPR